MGLPDMYSRVGFGPNQIKTPKQGWENTLMGFMQPTSDKDFRLLIDKADEMKYKDYNPFGVSNNDKDISVSDKWIN